MTHPEQAVNLANLKADRFLCLALNDRGPLLLLSCDDNISHLHFDQIAPQKFAVDSEIERGKAAVTFGIKMYFIKLIWNGTKMTADEARRSAASGRARRSEFAAVPPG